MNSAKRADLGLESSVTSIADVSDRTHHLVDALRTCLANPDATAVGTFARVVESLHAELNLMAPALDVLARGGPGGAAAVAAPVFDDDLAPGTVDALAEFLSQMETRRA